MIPAREWRAVYADLVQRRKTLGRPEPGPLPQKPIRKADKIDKE
jgi:hypothetical protein